jgi:hypothetical protein
MWTSSGGSSRKRRNQGGGEEEEDKDEEEDEEQVKPSNNLKKLVDQLDYRVRRIEAEVPTWQVLVPAGQEMPIIQKTLTEARKGYDDKLVKGKPHPDGHRRTTLAGALLLLLSEGDLTKASTSQKTEIDRMNEMLELVKQPSIQDQQTFLTKFLETYTTPIQFAPHVLICDCFKAKKNPKFIIQLKLNPETPISHVTEYVHWAMESLGGNLLTDIPPRGTLARAALGGKGGGKKA